MFDDQNHLLIPIAAKLKNAFDQRIESFIADEIRCNGLGQHTSDDYRRTRIATLKRYSDQALLRLADAFAEHIVARVVTYAPYTVVSKKNGHGEYTQDDETLATVDITRSDFVAAMSKLLLTLREVKREGGEQPKFQQTDAILGDERCVIYYVRLGTDHNRAFVLQA